MNQIHPENGMSIFTDAAVSSKAMIAVGAYLCIHHRHINQYAQYTAEDLFAKLTTLIVYTEYKSNKSTWTEIQTVIDALHVVLKKSGPNIKIDIYTDCESLCDLITRRREKLEKNNYLTKAGVVHQHAELYKELFSVTEKFQIKIFKIKGHAPSAHRLTLHEKIFAILDKMSRNHLRLMVNK